MAYGIRYKSNNGKMIEKSFQTMYHYTDMNALPNILRQDKIVLWGTNCLYLNDRQEIKEGISIVRKVLNIELQQGAFRNYYITSFSGNGDEMSMWRMYASDGHGCALGFNPKLVYLPSSDIFDFCSVCKYGEEELPDLKTELKFAKLTNHSLDKDDKVQSYNNQEQEVNNFLVDTCVSIKNHAFKIEQEVRGVKYQNDYGKVKARVKNGIIIPYIEVEIPKEALTEITLGPTNDSDLSMLSIIHHLKRCGYKKEDIRIVNSKVPYRG